MRAVFVALRFLGSSTGWRSSRTQSTKGLSSRDARRFEQVLQ